MQVIYKYSLPAHGTVMLLLPLDFHVLQVGAQDRQLVMWAQHSATEPSLITHFRVIFTGEEFEYNQEHMYYIGSATAAELVSHVYHTTKG